MDCEKMGRFICERRKERGMTQKGLAEQLHITDKAVSKWERGLSCPDIALLTPLAETLGVSVSELLRGERSAPDVQAVEAVDQALHYADKKAKRSLKSLRHLYAAAFSLLLLLGMLACVICDLAIAGTFTWSRYSSAAILYAWLVCFPVVQFGKKGVCGALISLTVFTVPFLYALDRLITANDRILPIGIPMTILSAVYLWMVYGAFWKWHTRKRFAAGVTVLLAIPLCGLVNGTLSILLSEPPVDVWDVLSMILLAAAAAVLFYLDVRQRKIASTL